MLVDLSKGENEVLDSIRGSEKYREEKFQYAYDSAVSEMRKIVAAAKIYILDNYQKIQDYSDLSLMLRCANHKGTIYIGKKNKERKFTSEILANVMKEIEEKTIQVDKFDLAVYDWSDGDFSVVFNGVSYNWIDSESIISIADHIEEKLELIKSGTAVCVDKFDNVISDGDILDVQMAGEHKVYSKNGELYFKPYGEESRVNDYFSNDLVIVKKK
jgi:hypothetical protein